MWYLVLNIVINMMQIPYPLTHNYDLLSEPKYDQSICHRGTPLLAVSHHLSNHLDNIHIWNHIQIRFEVVCKYIMYPITCSNARFLLLWYKSQAIDKSLMMVDILCNFRLRYEVIQADTTLRNMLSFDTMRSWYTYFSWHDLSRFYCPFN